MTVFVSGSDETAGKTHRDKFLFGGWIGPAKDWSSFFAPAWQERVLDGPPKIPYLHMTDIRSNAWREKHGLSRQQADDRVDEAVAVIDAMGSLVPISISVDAGCVRDYFKDAKVKSSQGGSKDFDPDYLCFLGYAWMALSYVDLRCPSAEKVDFIVERKGHVTKYIQEFHENLGGALTALGSRHLARLVGKLIPGDKDRIPLQAADVLCWHAARRDQNSLALEDWPRWSKLSHRLGAYVPLSNEQIVQISKALLPPKTDI